MRKKNENENFWFLRSRWFLSSLFFSLFVFFLKGKKFLLGKKNLEEFECEVEKNNENEEGIFEEKCGKIVDESQQIIEISLV